jgi:hypothetical protein
MTYHFSYQFMHSDGRGGFGDCIMRNVEVPRSANWIDACKLKIKSDAGLETASIVILGWNEMPYVS